MIHFLKTFINSGQLGCLQSLATMNSSAISMLCKWLYGILEHIPSDICREVVSLDHMVVLVLVF
jgi:hypothetical protein